MTKIGAGSCKMSVLYLHHIDLNDQIFRHDVYQQLQAKNEADQIYMDIDDQTRIATHSKCMQSICKMIFVCLKICVDLILCAFSLSNNRNINQNNMNIQISEFQIHNINVQLFISF